jgi:hypothetical protein
VIIGLSKCGVKWYSQSLEALASWEEVLAGDRGLVSMSPIELSQTIHSLGLMGLKWNTLPPGLAACFLQAFESRHSEMTYQGLSSSFWGLSKMGCGWESISSKIQDTVYSSSDSSSTKVDKSFAFSYLLVVQALEQFKAEISIANVAASLLLTADSSMQYLEADQLTELLSSLHNLKLLKLHEPNEITSRLLNRIKAGIKKVSPSKLAVLNVVLSKVSISP